MESSEHQRQVIRAYQAATKLLRKNHPEEFRQILHAIYEERGIKVQQRRAKFMIERDKLEEARRIIAEADSV